jgi:signal transduction histidine kinase
MTATLVPFRGNLGIDEINRNYFILDGSTAQILETSSTEENPRIEVTTNILRATMGHDGFRGRPRTDIMDIAVPIISEETGSRYIIYIIDNKQAVQSITRELIILIIQSVAIGFIVSIAISLIISRTLLSPIHGMTKAAAAMADGDFSSKIYVQSEDEIGILATTFNDMASQIESMLIELKKTEKLRREFVANVSHELRTPLTSIRTHAETIAENIDLPLEKRMQFLSVIINESDRMTKIVRDLLDLSRFDSEESNLNHEEFSLEMSVRNVYAAVALEAEKRGHNTNLELQWRQPKIVGDRARLEQVLINIISNALKYTPDGGTIDISSGTTNDMVWVNITDTGVGIPKDDLQYVFDRFYRVDKARSRESGGTGLGLSIAKDIIDIHNGDIKVESELGQGTSVTVFLPLTKENDMLEEKDNDQ